MNLKKFLQNVRSSRRGAAPRPFRDEYLRPLLESDRDSQYPLMPLLFSLAMHPSLVSTGDLLREGEKLFAFLDVVYLDCKPERVLEVFRLIKNAVWIHSRISVHCGKTQLWNRSGTTPRGCEDLARAAGALNPDAVVWRGDHRLPVVQQGVVVLGSPVGHDEFIKAKLMSKVTEHQTLLERIPLVRAVQSAWLLLLFCAATRANYWLRTGLFSSQRRTTMTFWCV